LPGVKSITEAASAHPSKMQLMELTKISSSNLSENCQQLFETTVQKSPIKQNGKSLNGVEAYSRKTEDWRPTPEWVNSWKQNLPLQTVMRLLQVLVPQVEKMCMEKGLTDESEILRFLQHGTLVGLLPVPHPILIRRYQANPGTDMWLRYIFLRFIVHYDYHK